MLGISDADLLQLCHSAIDAAERPAGSRSCTPAETPSVAAVPDQTSRHAAGRRHMPDTAVGNQACPARTKQSSQSIDVGAVGEVQALRRTDSTARHDVAASGSTGVPALSRETAADRAAAGDAAAASAAAARAEAGTSRPSSSSAPWQSSVEEKAPLARSLLDELLGGFCPLPAIPAPAPLEQQQSAAPTGNEPGVSATDSLHSAHRTWSGTDKSMVDTEEYSERDNPDLRMTAQVAEPTLVLSAPPTVPLHGSNVSTQQPGQQPAEKKLSLRERMRLLKGSG